ncbi:TlpA family protein disulfide reductase [Corynebacterium auris]|uniref:TlpA family protein disulfide reductase n=1 Tax=Corynebacterium auris TaxID=44750 RepID=UPI0025B381CB|nr:TlpA disulfide reductase family protein [Corynebacterium auris]WJY67131.1 Thiol:disulfide interchange protein CycY precursor [Corynebacterium auris]
MRKSILISVAAILAVTALLAVGLIALRPEPAGQESQALPTAGEAPDEASSREAVPPRPDCPAGGAGGVELECLGGERGDDQAQVGGVTVVNLWAWWCEPCRAELPVIEEFAQRNAQYTVVGVHADPAAGNGAALLNDLGVELPSYQDSENLFGGEFGLPRVVPITVVLRGDEQLAAFPYPFEDVDELEAAVAGVV